ncbi:MAG TPA: HAMP domain-containing methyl-accepting chemotaxis protein, partial [Polyangiaceae bacterium LLY-WYZ-15_(1-7)]|nr:HAMP domain-containing methyl-accepting chemotaxis protein [Polyangiaceae bacterium LLY-WYZ-15_(1-7)]
KQHRLTLVGRDALVLASVFPEDEQGDLGSALQEDAWGEAQEGEDMVAVILHADHMYDFHQDEGVRGYDGNTYGDLGSFFLMRQRDFKAQSFWDRFSSSLSTLLLFAGITLVLGWLLAWYITRRIRVLVHATEDLAQGQGDLTKRLHVGSTDDELGQLASNLNAVFAHIHELAAKVQRAAFQVGASSAEISAASRQMLDGAQEQARKTESSTAAVTELSASIQQVAENATEATRVARKSGEDVQSAIGRMQEIRTTVDEAAARIHELGESGKRIGNIVEVIRQISDQTTLLALNAAIEAAHAGEHGKGFAVVADEVSGLANRVGQSARDIEDLIATIKEQTQEAVRAMEAGTTEVEEGTRLVTRTLADLQTLVQVVEDTAHAVSEQAVASDEIARNMDAVQRIAAEVLGSSEEAVDQGEHLHRLAHGLEESVKGFRIEASRLEDGGEGAKRLPPGDAGE